MNNERLNGRTLTALFTWAILLPAGVAWIPVPILLKIGLVGVGVGVSFLFFTVLVPEVTGLIVLNFFTGELFAFKPGLHFKYPWDIVRDENFFPLELVTKGHEETYAAKDGPMMKVKWSYQYWPDENRLTDFIRVDNSTIDAGFVDVFSSILSEVIGGWERSDPTGKMEWSESVRREVMAVETEVIHRFQDLKLYQVRGNSVSGKDKLEEQYGVNFKLFKIADIDFSEDYQQARSGKARMAVITATAKQLIDATAVNGQPTISGKEAANLVLVEQDKAKKNIVEVEGGQGEPFLRAAATLGSMTGSKKGGN
ncbi:MAG TPA: hypothetical protein VNK70_01445 [Candidatus Paceibacterota bacterium]|nr:hypothetical protein [Candidatus Paceibacterota bacterium]